MKKKISIANIGLVLLLILIILFSDRYLRLKNGFHVDEGMTLYLSNGVYTGAVTTVPDVTIFGFFKTYIIKDTFSETVFNVIDMLRQVVHAGNYSVKGSVEWYDAARELLQGRNTWMSGSTLFDMCTASDSDRFNYLQVYLNQIVDVHPCVYYFLVHTVFSLFPGEYSIYFLYYVNIICLVITAILLYRVLLKITGRPEPGLFSVAIYGFSQGFVSCAILFRMYAVETLMVFSTFCFYMYLREKDYDFEKKDYVSLFIIEIMGFNTHYYYIVYLFAMFIVISIDMKKKKRKIKKYIITQVITGIASLMIWPFSLYHILFGYRGTEAFSRFTSLDYIGSIGKYLELCAKAMLFSWKAAILIIAVLIVIYVLSLKRDEGSGNFPWNVILIPVIVYLVIVGKVAPSTSSRYVMCLFPFIAMCLSILVFCTFNVFILNERIKKVIYAGLTVIYIICTLLFTTPDYLFRENIREPLVDVDRSTVNCLMIAPEHYVGFPFLLELSTFDHVMVVDRYLLETIKETRPDNLHEDMVVYIGDALDKDNIINELNEYGYLTDRKMKSISSDLKGFDAYYIGK